MAVAQLACLLNEKRRRIKHEEDRAMLSTKHVRMSGYWLAAVFLVVCLQTGPTHVGHVFGFLKNGISGV